MPELTEQRSAEGLPPLARGILDDSWIYNDAVGITPARAGNTLSQIKLAGWHRDHPRSRGEYILPGSLHEKPLGSPPLARGIPAINTKYSNLRGITPARAGNTAPTSTAPVVL